MIKLIRIFIMFSAGIFILHCAKDQASTAKAGLDTLNKLITEDTVQFTQYKDVQEVAKSTLGDPMKVYTLGLDDIDQYTAGKAAKELLKESDRFVYPVYVGSELKSSVEIQKIGGKWEITELGGKIAFLAEPSRKKMPGIIRDPNISYFVVNVPAMYLVMLGYESEGRLFFVQTHEHPDFKIGLEMHMPAEEVLKILKPLTAKYRNVLIPDKDVKK